LNKLIRRFIKPLSFSGILLNSASIDQQFSKNSHFNNIAIVVVANASLP